MLRPRREAPTRRQDISSLPPVLMRSAHRVGLAGGLGFEPRLTESESAVLPLNYPPIGKTLTLSVASGARPVASLLLLVRAVPERRRDASPSRTSRSAFQARKARPFAWKRAPHGALRSTHCLTALADAAQAVRRPDMPKATVAIATSAQAAT